MTDMRVDIDFVGESVTSVTAAENLDVALKHLADVAAEVSRALGQVELPASNVATSVANMKVMERGLNSLENQAQRTKRQLAEVEVFHSGLPNVGGLSPRSFVAGPGSGTGFASRDSSWGELAAAIAKADAWAKRFEQTNRRVFGSFGSQGPYMGGSRKTFPFVDERTGERQGDEFVRGFERVLRRRGGSGGGRRGGFDSFLLGRSGSGASTQSLGSLVPGGAKATGPALLAGVAGGVTALAPLLPGVVGALAVIPALASAGAGALITLGLAFSNVGEAIGGNKKAYDKLVPAQKEFVDTMRNQVIPLINGAKQVAAKGLFPGLTAAIKQMADSKPLMLAFGNALHAVGVALGNLAKMFAQYLTSSGFLGQFSKLTKELEPIIRQFGKAFLVLLDVFVRLAVAFAPLLHWMGQMSVHLATMADNWVKATDASGGFGRMIPKMENSLVLTARLVQALARFLGELVLALIPAGTTIDTSIVGGLNRMATWLHKNHEAVQKFVNDAVHALIGALKALYDVVHAAVLAFQDVHKWIGKVTGVTLDARDAFRLLFAAMFARSLLGLIGIQGFGGLAKAIFGARLAIVGEKGLLPALLALPPEITIPIILTISAVIFHKQISSAISGASNAVLHALGINTSPTFKNGWHVDPKTGKVVANPVQAGGNKATTVAQDAADRKGAPRTSKPGGGTTGATTGGKNVTWSGATAGLNGSFVAKVQACVGAAGGNAIHVDSGKRSDAAHPGGPTNHGVPNSNHLTGHALDGSVRIHGVWYPAGAAPMAYGRYGLRSGNAPGFYKGARDPSHVDDGTNVGGVSGSNANAIVPVGSATPFAPGPKGPQGPAPATAASRRAGALAASKDIARAQTLMHELGTLGVHTATHTIQGVTVTETIGASLSKQDANLKKQIATWEKQLAADRKFLLTHKHLTTQMVANIKQRDREIAAAIAAGKAKIDKEVQARADAFDKAWADLTARAMRAFDNQTEDIEAGIARQRKHFLTPTEALIKQLTDTRTERDLNQAIDDAKQTLDDALAGIGADTAQETLDRITGVIGRYSLAHAVDVAQAAILGGGAMDMTGDLLKELHDASVPAAGAVDQKAVNKARQDYADAVEDYRIYKLQPIADAEREDQDERDRIADRTRQQARDDLRTALNDQLTLWGNYWKGVGASASQAYAIFDEVWFKLTGNHLPPLSGAANTPGGGTGTGSTGGNTNAPGTPTGIGGHVPGGGGLSTGEQGAPPVSTPNPAGPGATAVTAATGGAGGVVDIWNVNSPGVDIGNLKAGGANLVIQAGDPDGQALRFRAVAAGVPYKVQVVAAQDDTPESFAARVAAAKAAFPDASAFILDIEGIPEKNADWNTRAASLVKNAAGGTPISVTNEPMQDINYKAWKDAGADFPVQAYGTAADGSYIDYDVQDVVDRVVANGVPANLVVPIIHPGQPLGRYKGRYSVFGVVPVKPLAPSAPPVSPNIQKVLDNGGITPTPAITKAIQDALTTTEAPLPVFAGPKGSGIKMMAEGGILTRPTLMIGGEAGPEGFMRLNDPRAKSMLGGDGPLTIVLSGVVALDDKIDARIDGSTRRVAVKMGQDSDRRLREGRF